MRLAPLLVATFALIAGCAMPAPDDASAPPPRCADPYPCADGSEWPRELAGAEFALGEILPFDIAAHDGISLRGGVLLPELPAGVRAPVLIVSAPYFGQCASNAGFQCGDAATSAPPEGSYRDRLVRAGYALMQASVRGTGRSGGCWEMMGPNEVRDQATLVEWAAAQEWSNGRVGMIGISYMGTTPWMAAIQAPPALKTIVPAGIVSDLYTFGFTPQGAPGGDQVGFWPPFAFSNSISPPLNDVVPGELSPEDVTRLAERGCPDSVAMLETGKGQLTDMRNEAFWSQRRFIDRYDDIKASVFVVHGLQDNTGHAFQEDEIWPHIPAPKRMLLGQWGHLFPPPEDALPRDFYEADLFPWLDFWLKGLGDAPGALGTVEYQDTSGAWHATGAWPPVEAREEVLYLADGALAPAPGAGGATFRAVPRTAHPACADARGDAVVFASEPLTASLLLAGNPMAYLTITSDMPGGQVGVRIYASDAATCEGLANGLAMRAGGVADLRFHAGNMQGTDFPVGTPTPVRIDLFNNATRVEAGERIYVVVSSGAEGQAPDLGAQRGTIGQPFTPQITLGADSHVVLPLVGGTLGGAEPTVAYPPRPFVPAT